MSFGHCGCAAERGLGDINVMQHGIAGGLREGMAPTQTGMREVTTDVALGAAAFTLPILYAKLAPKRWPHTKKLWQDVAVVVVLYLGGNYLVRKVV